MNEVQVKLRKRRLPKDLIERKVRRILEVLGVEGVEVSVLITGDREISELNRTYRGKEGPTDVLSFPMGDRIGGKVILGDVVVSVETAERQARSLGHSLEREVERLLVHGIIHLLGYDHELGGEEEVRFRELEEKVLDELGRG